jgi:hypothetical protein
VSRAKSTLRKNLVLLSSIATGMSLFGYLLCAAVIAKKGGSSPTGHFYHFGKYYSLFSCLVYGTVMNDDVVYSAHRRWWPVPCTDLSCAMDNTICLVSPSVVSTVINAFRFMTLTSNYLFLTTAKPLLFNTWHGAAWFF